MLKKVFLQWPYVKTYLCIAGLAGIICGNAFAITPSALKEYERGVTLEKQRDYAGAEAAYRTAIGLDPYDSLTYEKLANLLAQDNKPRDALQMYQQALALNPKDSMIHLSIAQIFENLGQSDKALAAYNQLIHLNPDYMYGYLPKARLEYKLKNQPAAIADYKTFLMAYPGHTEAQRELAGILLADKQYGQAAQQYKSLKAQKPQKFKDDLAYGIALNQSDHPKEALDVFMNVKTPSALLYEQQGSAYEKLNQSAEAHEAYSKAIKLAPKREAFLYLRMADLAQGSHQNPVAIADLQAYLKTDPGNIEAAKGLGDLYLQDKNYPQAIAAYETALQNTPEKNTAIRDALLRNIGFAYQSSNQVDKAQAAYEKSLKNEDNEQARLNLAIIYQQKGDYEKALTLYKRLLVENPKADSIKTDMGQIEIAIGKRAYEKGDYVDALSHYQDAYLLGSNQDLPALLGMANSQYALKNNAIAYGLYEQVLAKDPNNMAALLNKAQLDLAAGNMLEATQALRKVADQQPANADSVNAMRLLAQTYANSGDYAQAALINQKALTIKPADTDLLINLGNAWREMGNYRQAETTYEKARALSPHNALVNYNLAGVYSLDNKPDAAVLQYKETLKTDPAFLAAYYGLGTAYERQKRYTDALRAYRTYLDKSPVSGPYVATAKARIKILNPTITVPATAAPVKDKKEKTAPATPVKTDTKEPARKLEKPAIRPSESASESKSKTPVKVQPVKAQKIAPVSEKKPAIVKPLPFRAEPKIMRKKTLVLVKTPHLSSTEKGKAHVSAPGE